MTLFTYDTREDLVRELAILLYAAEKVQTKEFIDSKSAWLSAWREFNESTTSENLERYKRDAEVML